jgi:hypothetical protein
MKLESGCYLDREVLEGGTIVKFFLFMKGIATSREMTESMRAAIMYWTFVCSALSHKAVQK